jgi:hypothetical protein
MKQMKRVQESNHIAATFGMKHRGQRGQAPIISPQRKKNLCASAALAIIQEVTRYNCKVMLDLHKLAVERSHAFHQEIAQRLLGDATILDNVRKRVRNWMTETPQRPCVREWAKILEGTPETIAAFLVSRSELAEELRQSSPFAGVLQARERWRIWRETRDALTGRQ